MRIVSKAKDDAGDSADLWRGRPRGFDALGLPIPVRRLGAKRLLIARGIRAGWLLLRANLAAAILRHNRPTRAVREPAGMDCTRHRSETLVAADTAAHTAGIRRPREEGGRQILEGDRACQSSQPTGTEKVAGY
jgi:hypothetical protein